MRKALAATALCMASVGVYASGAIAGPVYPPDTTSTTVESEGPEPSVSVEPPVVVTPGPEVGEETLVTDPGTLPATGSDPTLLLQIGAGAFVVGLTTIVLVRRRKPNPAG